MEDMLNLAKLFYNNTFLDTFNDQVIFLHINYLFCYLKDAYIWYIVYDDIYQVGGTIASLTL